ncbi:MAG TPA: pyrroline-5-carboxylate reductase [Candidatus Baltobacteraceae bacterium]|nr:pyrroline-5-carboxylate reductase [Candidatus Baltobacteraceae bacterium]
MIVGIVGFGTLGRAIASGLRDHPGVEEIIATSRRGLAVAEFPDVAVSRDNAALARRADVILLCVKPFQMEAIVRELSPALTADKLVITAAAAITTVQVESWIERADVPVVRAMPNTPFRIGEGMTVLAAGSHATAEHLDLARSLFESHGRTAVVEERLMDAVTGISGCGPAYMYVVIEALSDAGVKLGLPRETARLLVAQTMLGSAKLVLSSDQHPAALKDEVTTPAGCTIDGLMELEDGKLRHTLLRAAVAAAKRSASLAKE